MLDDKHSTLVRLYSIDFIRYILPGRHFFDTGCSGCITSENGIHALPIMSNGQTLWAGYLGTPISYGCIVLGTYEAKLLYDWAEMGTSVTIQP